MKSGKIHYAWIVLAGCCAFGISSGWMINSKSVFVVPITQELGLGMGVFSVQSLLCGLALFVVTPLTSYLFRKVDSRLLLGVISVLHAANAVMLSFAKGVFLIYAGGIIDGLTGSFFRVYPLLLFPGNWFREKRGLATGIAMASAGLFGIIGNPLINRWILRFGWRIAYRIVGLCLLLVLFPAGSFILRLEPSMMGIKPYGETPDPEQKEITEEDGPDAAFIKKTSSFWMLVTGATAIALLLGYVQFLSPLGISFGYSAQTAAWLGSCCMAGNTGSKIVIGQLSDRLGLKKTLSICFCMIPLGFILLLVNCLPCRLLGALLYGFTSGISVVLIPSVAFHVYGNRSYNGLLSILTMPNSIGYSIGCLLLGVALDVIPAENPHIPLIIYCTILVMIAESVIIASILLGRKSVKAYMDKKGIKLPS